MTAESFSIAEAEAVPLIGEVLHAAGKVAGNLRPKLQLIEVWDVAWNVARLFRHQVVNGDTATITWISNLDEPGFLDLIPEVMLT